LRGRLFFLSVTAEEQRISGFAACNQMTGGYQLDGNKLSFSRIAMTARACPEGMDPERALGKALEETRRYEISADALRLRMKTGRSSPNSRRTRLLRSVYDRRVQIENGWSTARELVTSHPNQPSRNLAQIVIADSA
jgi:hypothetical protein